VYTFVVNKPKNNKLSHAKNKIYVYIILVHIHE